MALSFHILLCLHPAKVVFSRDGKNVLLVVDGLAAQHGRLARNSPVSIKPPIYLGGLPSLKRQVNNYDAATSPKLHTSQAALITHGIVSMKDFHVEKVWRIFPSTDCEHCL